MKDALPRNSFKNCLSPESKAKTFTVFVCLGVDTAEQLNYLKHLLLVNMLTAVEGTKNGETHYNAVSGCLLGRPHRLLQGAKASTGGS